MQAFWLPQPLERQAGKAAVHPAHGEQAWMAQVWDAVRAQDQQDVQGGLQVLREGLQEPTGHGPAPAVRPPQGPQKGAELRQT